MENRKGRRNVGFSRGSLALQYTLEKGKTKNSANYTQNPTQTLHFADIPCFTMCMVCASNYTQTIHKPYIEAFKTLHSERSQNYTRSGTQTLHFVLNTNLANGI